jgi:AbrB family looped-hinge helix DNA binding protein
MELIKSRIDKAGRLVIPNHYRQVLDLIPGEEVMLRLEDGEMHVCSFKKAAEKARDLITHYNHENHDLLEILFKHRREEIRHE